MALPEATILSRCRHWKVFGTGTFSGQRVPGANAQRKLVFAFLYRAAGIAGEPFGRLLWTTRREHGELGGRVHYHWLIGSDCWTPTVSQMFFLNVCWDSLPGCGFARHHIFNAALNGVEYVTKCLSAEDHGSLGGDYYEGSKFSNRDTEVTLSNSLARLVAGRRVGVLSSCSAGQC